MTATTTTRTTSNGQPRKTLASQLDRLDGILDGQDAALAGAVQEAVEQAVKQAVQAVEAVLTEVLTNGELQEQLQQAAQPGPLPEESHGKLRIIILNATSAVGISRFQPSETPAGDFSTASQCGQSIFVSIIDKSFRRRSR